MSVKQGGTNLGDIYIELFTDIAPKHAANFDELVGKQFFDGTAFHRVIPNFMIQGGDPNSRSGDPNTWGMGDPNQKRVPAEFSKISHKRGIISAARSQDPNSASSQFFICVADSPWLDGQYSVYGQVLSGMDVADKIVNAKRNSSDRPDVKIEMTVRKM
ncbi:MAG TPA: peptidylprolyl isomerase [Candidatus Kapabacteria bacterium]|nr:peptidylprolyl isomerase [Candidatus Kapabacteria bacterium]